MGCRKETMYFADLVHAVKTFYASHVERNVEFCEVSFFNFRLVFVFPSYWEDMYRWKNAQMKTKIVYRLQKRKEKEKSRVCQKQRKKSIHENIKTTAKRARMCLCDFIRPKMETYLFPAIRWPEIRVFSLSTFRYSSISCLSSLFHFCFVIISTKERAEEEKKHQKMFEEFKWFKVFRDGRFRAGLKNLLMKFLEASKPERRKKKKHAIMEKRNNDKPELLPTNITQFLGLLATFCCPVRIFPSSYV